MERLLRPASIAVVGGGAWCRAVLEQTRKIGFAGPVWHVHPTAEGAFTTLDDLPGVPDAVYVGVNRQATIGVVAALRAMGAGGAVCFASGFKEAADGAGLHDALLEAAGDMPVLGPNCYGLLNALDRVALWPDQHGLVPVDRGVAIIAQSSNIAINLTMQRRGLPIAYAVTAGNQAQQGMAQIGAALLGDDRVTALGLYVESFGDVPGFEALAALAAELGKPIVALKVGQSDAAQRATVSHTASLAGSAAGAEALLARLGIASVSSLTVFLETLKIFHCFGRLPGVRIASLSCSGGEASVMADAAARHGLMFPTLSGAQHDVLSQHLSPLVQLTNPLDYHTDIWRNKPAMTAVFAAMAGPDADLTIVVLDFPHADRCSVADWITTVEAIEAAADGAGRFAVLATMPENMPEEIATRLMVQGIVPLSDVDQGFTAIRAAASPVASPLPSVWPVAVSDRTRTLTEGGAKVALAAAGMDVPRRVFGVSQDGLAEATAEIGFPLVLKGEGMAHKTEQGAVAVDLADMAAVLAAADAMQVDSFLIEEMIGGAVAEFLVGVVADPAHGFVLTLAAGGTLTELLQDRQSLLLPVDADAVRAVLGRLRIAPVLQGYRGQPGADLDAIVQAVMQLQGYVGAHRDVTEIEINPLICTKDRAVVADALLVKGTS